MSSNDQISQTNNNAHNANTINGKMKSDIIKNKSSQNKRKSRTSSQNKKKSRTPSPNGKFNSRTPSPNEKFKSRTPSPKRELTNEEKNYIIDCIKNEGVFHFIDFEFFIVSNDYKPLEIGISTFKLTEFKEVGNYHSLINPKVEYSAFMKESIAVHGIQKWNTNEFTKNYEMLATNITNYMKTFEEVKQVFVVKDRTLGGDKVCFDILFQGNDENNNSVFCTHTELFDCWKEEQEIDIDFDVTNYLDDLYRQYRNSSKCEYHMKKEDHFHCALGDARDTAVMFFNGMRNVKEGYFKQTEELPVVKPFPNEINIYTNTVIYISFSEYPSTFSQSPYPKEICFSAINLENGEIEKRKLFIFHYDGRPLKRISEDVKMINDYFEKNELKNSQVEKEMKDFVESLEKNDKTVVFIGGRHIFKRLCRFNNGKYAFFSKEIIKTLIPKALSEIYNLEPPHNDFYKNYSENIEINIENDCFLHKHCQSKDCAVNNSLKNISLLQYMIWNFQDLYQIHNHENTSKKERVMMREMVPIEEEDQ